MSSFMSVEEEAARYEEQVGRFCPPDLHERSPSSSRLRTKPCGVRYPSNAVAHVAYQPSLCETGVTEFATRR